jgi:hypothetical protein
MQQKNFIFTIIMLTISTLAQAQWTKANLAEKRGSLAATYFNGKVLFLGGDSKETGQESDVMDIYDPITQKWATSTMPIPRYDISFAALGTKLYTYGVGFSDKSQVAVYDQTKDAWTTLTVQGVANSPNTVIKGLGNKLYISYDQVLHEYDLTTATTTPLSNLGASRRETAVEIAGTKVLIAGGISGNTVSKDVDIYDTATKAWSKISLSEARRSVTPLLHQQKLYLIGGGTDNGYKNSDVIDVYDPATGNLSSITMPFKRLRFATTALGDNLYIAGGYDESQTTSDIINIYNIKTNTWTTDKLSAKKSRLAAINDGKRVYFAGGHLGSSTSYQTVDIWQATTGLINVPSLELSLKIYPNPTTEKLTIEWQNIPDESLSLVVADALGRVIYEEKIIDNQNRLELNCKAWQQGIYIITLSNGKAVQSCKMEKE